MGGVCNELVQLTSNELQKKKKNKTHKGKIKKEETRK